uniref:SH2 domain-containing protein n=1 Tax=Steinernema glaseri TaxID=37863 RepID=A0A1I8ANR1_9BILA
MPTRSKASTPAVSPCPSPNPCAVCVVDTPVQFRRGPFPSADSLGEPIPLPRKRSSFNGFSTVSTIASPSEEFPEKFEDLGLEDLDEVPEMPAPPPPRSPVAPPRRNRPSRGSESPTAPSSLSLESTSPAPMGVAGLETPYEEPLSVRGLAATLAESGKVRIFGRPQLRKEDHLPSEETGDLEDPPTSTQEPASETEGESIPESRYVNLVPVFPVTNPMDTTNLTSIENLIKERRRFKNRPPPPPPSTKPALKPLCAEEEEGDQGHDEEKLPAVGSLTKRASVVSEDVLKKLDTERSGVAVYRIPPENSPVDEATRVLRQGRRDGRHHSLVIVNPAFGLDAPEKVPSTPGYEKLSLIESTTTVVRVGTTSVDGSVQIPVTHAPQKPSETPEACEANRKPSDSSSGYEAPQKEKLGARRSVQRADAVDLDVSIVTVPSPPPLVCP